MPNIQTLYQPGSASTVTEAGPGPGGPSELTTFYRDLLKRQQTQAQMAPPPAPIGYGPGRSYGNAPDRAAASSYRPEQSAMDRARQNEEMQEMAYRKRLRDIDLNPPVKYIDSRPGIQGGYIQDTSLLPVSMRPSNAAVDYGPQDVSRAQGQFAQDQAFNAQLDAHRARTQNTNLNSYYGR